MYSEAVIVKNCLKICRMSCNELFEVYIFSASMQVFLLISKLNFAACLSNEFPSSTSSHWNSYIFTYFTNS